MTRHSSEDGRRVELRSRLWETIRANYHLGFTSFGGPPVHFKIFHEKFVQRLHWIDEETYQELFSVCQAFSGPGSTKMHYCINLIRGGSLPALLGFFIWSLPGAFAMYGLSVGVANIGELLPGPVYALLSGLNAATVGIVAVAAVQLSEKAITDGVTRLLVFFGAAAGILYNALWYFPLLMLAAALATVVHDYRWLHRPVKSVARLWNNVRHRHPVEEVEAANLGQPPHAAVPHDTATSGVESTSTSEETGRGPVPRTSRDHEEVVPITGGELSGAEEEARTIPPQRNLGFSWRVGTGIIVLFAATFVAIMVLRGTVPGSRVLFRFFANMYLAGTIIFGGGPVVIPLLREYVVEEGWVSSRDFLIGLALQQSFPGPNFNFAVYLGALTAAHAGYASALGAVLGFLGIFVPGLVMMHGTMGIWGSIRGVRWVKSLLRGINAAAVGLIYTAVYRLWQIGYVDRSFHQGTNLGQDPWWVVVTAASFFFGYSYGASPPLTIVLGAALGLIWYLAVGK